MLYICSVGSMASIVLLYQFACPPVRPPVRPFAHPSVGPSVRPSACPAPCPPARPRTHAPGCLSRKLCARDALPRLFPAPTTAASSSSSSSIVVVFVVLLLLLLPIRRRRRRRRRHRRRHRRRRRRRPSSSSSSLHSPTRPQSYRKEVTSELLHMRRAVAVTWALAMLVPVYTAGTFFF